ncbi:MAG TPA: hypothetical protein VF884_00335 [Nitrososphaeraceae archaeon]
MKNQKTTLLALGIAIAVSIAIAPLMIIGASASITPGSPPSCSNGGDKLPPGQQEQCTNDGGLTQDPGTCASNPNTKCPPGQNK